MTACGGTRPDAGVEQDGQPVGDPSARCSEGKQRHSEATEETGRKVIEEGG